MTTLLLLASYLFRNHYKILSTKWVNSTERIFLIFKVKAKPELLRNTIQLLITREFSLQLSRLQAISDYWFYSPSTEIEFSIPNGLSTKDIKSSYQVLILYSIFTFYNTVSLNDHRLLPVRLFIQDFLEKLPSPPTSG